MFNKYSFKKGLIRIVLFIGIEATVALTPVIKAQDHISYEQAKENFEIRQGYLNQILEEKRSKFKNVSDFRYREDTTITTIEIVMEIARKNNVSVSTMNSNFDLEELHMADMYILCNDLLVDGYGKYPVFVFPKAFAELNEYEFYASMLHENKHVDDCVAKPEYYLAIKNSEVRKNLLELSAFYTELSEMDNENITEVFREKRYSDYEELVKKLNDYLKDNSISEYEKGIINNDLSNYGKLTNEF